MWFKASSTTMSCLYGTLYSWKYGFESFSGRYRVTRIVAMSWLILLVDTLLWFPSCYRDGKVIDPWGTCGLVCHGVFEKVSVISFRVVGRVVSASRFMSQDCGVRHRFCYIEHEVEF